MTRILKAYKPQDKHMDACLLETAFVFFTQKKKKKLNWNFPYLEKVISKDELTAFALWSSTPAHPSH